MVLISRFLGRTRLARGTISWVWEMWRIWIFGRINMFRGFGYCLGGVRIRIRFCLVDKKSGNGVQY